MGEINIILLIETCQNVTQVKRSMSSMVYQAVLKLSSNAPSDSSAISESQSAIAI